MALELWQEMFDPNAWASGGPDLLQRSFLNICGFNKNHTLKFEMTRERMSREKCQGIQLLDYKSFFPIGWRNHKQFWELKTRDEWYEQFQHSYGLHFYHSSSQRFNPYHDINPSAPSNATKPALQIFALDHCPVSFWSNQTSF